LFVSKPLVPPWKDGSKNLVRDVASHVQRVEPTVMTVEGIQALPPHVRYAPVYRDPGRFAPGLRANARVVGHLLRGDPLDGWVFAFAPNPLSSSVARGVLWARRAAGWTGPVVQILPSAPRSFEGVQRWLFGDVLVALSTWTKARLVENGVPSERVRVIPPCVPEARTPSPEAVAALRAKYGLGQHPVVLYPGDYEVSTGARTVSQAVARIVAQVPEARVVFACRAKTPRSREVQAQLQDSEARLGVAEYTRHVGQVEDFSALLAASTVLAFPVDDLYGKVDVPLVLLEALAQGVPLVVASGGPLDELTFAPKVAPGAVDALAAEVVALLRDATRRHTVAQEGQSSYRDRYTPHAVARMYDALFSEVLAPGQPRP
jgi:phosphatidylinositol alpha-1,6-mannosyltransferase